jgi:hypothetical protein
MVLHCASRLGTLSYLYEKRNDIAFSIGLISEIPMSMCSSNYQFSKKLFLQQEDTKQHAPISFSGVQEIVLFSPVDVLSLTERNPLHYTAVKFKFLLQHYLTPHLDIFHPPSE